MVIGPAGEQIGVISITDALAQAQSHGLDLVEVAPLARPPVCKILDYGKFLYQQDKNERKMKARVKKTAIKGIRLTLKIGAHDKDIRRKQSQKFLDQNDKVKIEMLLRGRERAYTKNAVAIIEEFIRSLEGAIVQESRVTVQGGRLAVIIYKK